MGLDLGLRDQSLVGIGLRKRVVAGDAPQLSVAQQVSTESPTCTRNRSLPTE